MKTLIISEQYGIFCGMNGNFACFSKDPMLAGPTAYAFDSKDRAEKFVSKMPEVYQEQMTFKEIEAVDNYVPLYVLIKQGLKEHTGHMLDILVHEDSTKH